MRVRVDSKRRPIANTNLPSVSVPSASSSSSSPHVPELSPPPPPSAAPSASNEPPPCANPTPLAPSPPCPHPHENPAPHAAPSTRPPSSPSTSPPATKPPASTASKHAVDSLVAQPGTLPPVIATATCPNALRPPLPPPSLHPSTHSTSIAAPSLSYQSNSSATVISRHPLSLSSSPALSAPNPATQSAASTSAGQPTHVAPVATRLPAPSRPIPNQSPQTASSSSTLVHPPKAACTSTSASAVAAAKPVLDDERSSDSGSSIATEAYNSEDEHPGPDHRVDIPVRTLREREREFSQLLCAKGLRIVEMRPDGNCLFRALAHNVWHDAEQHVGLRARVMQYLVQERDYFSQFVAEDFARYVRRKGREGTHGNHLELQAAAELFGRAIEVYSYGDTPATIVDSWSSAAGAVNGNPGCAPEPIRLSFHRGCHYNSVVSANGGGKAAGKIAMSDVRQAEMEWRAGTEAFVNEEEMERAVMALSLVEATRGDSGVGSSSSGSSAMMVPSDVLALVNLGYSEDVAYDAYRVAGNGGLMHMVRYVTSDRAKCKSAGGGGDVASGGGGGGHASGKERRGGGAVEADNLELSVGTSSAALAAHVRAGSAASAGGGSAPKSRKETTRSTTDE